MRAGILLTFALATAIFNSGCKSRLQVQPVNPAWMAADSIRKLADSATGSFDVVSIRGKGDFVSPDESLGFTYIMDFKSDSLIWFSVTKFGYEGLRCLADSDSVRVKITDKKKVIRCDFSLVAQMTGFEVGIGDLQSLMLGRPVYTGDSLFLSEASENAYVINSKRGKTKFTYFIDKSNFRLLRFETENDELDAKTAISYSDYELAGKQIVPGNVHFAVLKPLELSISFSHSKAETEQVVPRTAFRIPENYQVEDCPSSGN